MYFRAGFFEDGIVHCHHKGRVLWKFVEHGSLEGGEELILIKPRFGKEPVIRRPVVEELALRAEESCDGMSSQARQSA